MASDQLVPNPTVRPREEVIQRLEEVIASLLNILDQPTPQTLTIPIFTRPGRQVRSSQNVTRNAFPGKASNMAWKFTVILSILGHIHRCIVEDVIMTKRDIYYQDPELFRSQNVVDKIVDDIAYTLGVGRTALNVTGTPKGLVYGEFEIRRADGTVVHGNSDTQGVLVPASYDATEEIDVSGIFWVLVLEKEAAFRSLVEAGLTSLGRRPGMLVTAKGYPDVETRAFLHRLAQQDPCLPIHVLTDFDPDGLAIAAVYAVGSIAMAHEAERLVLPRLSWVGVCSGEVIAAAEASGLSAGVDHGPEGAEADAGANRCGLLQLTARDRRHAVAMLGRSLSTGASWSDWEQWRRELQVMLKLNIKAEMQVLEQTEGGISTWLKTKLSI